MTAPFILPETAAVLQALAAMDGPHLGDLPAPAAREVYHQLGDAFEEAADPAVRTVDFEGEGVTMRAYFPGDAQPGPVIVYYHGGGWVIGDLDTHNALCARLASVTGLRVVAVDYRLAPEHPYPAAHDDCLSAARFVAQGPSVLEAPVKGIALAGDSAGGALALAVGGKLEPAQCLAQFLIYPVGDCTEPEEGSYAQFAEGFLLDRKLMHRFIEDYLPNLATRQDRDVSPLLHELPASSPPTVILTADLDPLRDQGRALASRLIMQGAECHYLEAAGLIHGMATMRRALPSGDAQIVRGALVLADLLRNRKPDLQGES